MNSWKTRYFKVFSDKFAFFVWPYKNGSMFSFYFLYSSKCTIFVLNFFIKLIKLTGVHMNSYFPSVSFKIYCFSYFLFLKIHRKCIPLRTRVFLGVLFLTILPRQLIIYSCVFYLKPRSSAIWRNRSFQQWS